MEPLLLTGRLALRQFSGSRRRRARRRALPAGAGSAAAVAARVDSLEHGMGLDPALLTQMAAQGTALTPTLTVITGSLEQVAARPDSPVKVWYVGGASVHGQLCAAAAEAGVTILAGTDSRPHGRIAGEIRALAAGVVPPRANSARR